MENVTEFLRDIGEWAGDGNLTRGVLTVSAAVLAAVLTTWRAIRRKPAERVKIDAPATVSIRVDPIIRQ